MSLEEFKPKKFSAAHKQLIRQANKIIEEYKASGHRMTLRMIHYQFVARDLYENTQQNYKRLGNVVDAARKAGLIPWDAIEDTTRLLRRIPVWNTPETAVEQLRDKFKLDPWDEQPTLRRIEVWIEKDAAVGIVRPTCNALRLPYFSCRGYSSSTGLYDAGKRLASFRAAGYETLVLYLGDHDPSGLQMTDSTEEKVNMFARTDIEFRRIALTMEQIKEHNPPANFAKETDSRTKWYIDTVGTDDAWELDALSPTLVDELIRSHVEPLIDQKAWDATMETEKEHLATLEAIVSDWKRTKAAPDMLDLIRGHRDLSPQGEIAIDEEHSNVAAIEDTEALLDVITRAEELMVKHELD